MFCVLFSSVRKRDAKDKLKTFSASSQCCLDRPVRNIVEVSIGAKSYMDSCFDSQKGDRLVKCSLAEQLSGPNGPLSEATLVGRHGISGVEFGDAWHPAP